MDKITRDIYICRDTIPQPIHYVAGTNAIPIVLKFRDWTIPSGGTAAIYLTKPSGLIVYDAAEIDADANTVTITPTTQLFAESGSQWGQVQIVDGDTIAATFRLLFLVGENMVDSEAIESTNEYTALEALIAQAQQVVSDTTDAIAALQAEVGYYGTCATAAAMAAKTVTVADSFTLAAGATVRVKFTYANTASSPTLNVNDTGAVAMVMYGTTAMTTYRWREGAVVEFTYDGTSWVSHQSGGASTTYYGVTKLTDGVTSTSTSTAATPNAVKTAYDAAVAAQETADANAESIDELNSNAQMTTLYGTGVTLYYNAYVVVLAFNVSGLSFTAGERTDLTSVIVWPDGVTPTRAFYFQTTVMKGSWAPTGVQLYLRFSNSSSSGDYNASGTTSEDISSGVLADTFTVPRSFFSIS